MLAQTKSTPDEHIFALAAYRHVHMHAYAPVLAHPYYPMHTLQYVQYDHSICNQTIIHHKTSSDFAAAPGRWRQHGSQHGLVQQSSRQKGSASVQTCASAKISSQANTATMRVSAADQWQPGAPTASLAARCGTLWGSP